MRLQYPKNIQIDEMMFKMKYSTKVSGGCVDFRKRVIVISTKSQHPTEILSTIIHELKEAIQLSQGVQYVTPDCDETFKFIYGHPEHTDLCNRLAGLLDSFIK